MNDNIDKNEIRKAIDRLQAEHPCGIAYDPTAFVNMEAVNTIKGCIDKIARRMMEDTEINIICEFAKLYLEGVRPLVEQESGEWVKEWKEVPITGGILHEPYWSCPRCGRKWEAYSAQFITFCSKCGMKLIDGDCEEGDPK